MTSLELRKQMLILESEMNRVQLSAEMAALAGGIRELSIRAKSVGAIAASSAVLVSGFAAIPRHKAAEGGAGTTLLQTFAIGSGLVSLLSLVFQARARRRQINGQE